ncbi:hypothetical protein Tery_3566 [Trichodesmium erythraeum IMS101]|uniref:Uncharacterized protein n=1 Tax=Trichodesmium erythraeum (strain IMS101) TaxID=203124 RepID=Q10YM4_TRIEI|nr:hypothetical protein [Trichodesmium erythraeum GBRTRLIN201]MCH2047562.1 hypothetical protein [Trichodesmium sp. ALOHA_ZT_67]MCL2928740.1 hypothetical protein [Trichodesmium sp. MAG_R01]MDE5093903.1 hypothetical protein [Trichodesmium sp. St11_bin5]
MENKETLSRTLNNSKSQLKWLEIAEYSALGTSILTLFFEQILFAATSIILALFLNRINRKIFEEKIQKQIDNEIEELTIDISSVFQNLDSRPNKNTEQTPEVSINSYQNQSNFEYSTITKEDWEGINIKFSEIEEELQSLKDLATDLQQNLGYNLELTKNTSMANEIEELKAQITKLQELNRDIVRPYFIRLIRAVKQLQNTGKY